MSVQNHTVDLVHSKQKDITIIFRLKFHKIVQIFQNESIRVRIPWWVKKKIPFFAKFRKANNFFCYFTVLLLVSAIVASPQGTTPSAPKKCEVCSADFVPICAAPVGSKDDKDKLSFGSVCIMRKYNCEHNKSKFRKY